MDYIDFNMGSPSKHVSEAPMAAFITHAETCATMNVLQMVPDTPKLKLAWTCPHLFQVYLRLCGAHCCAKMKGMAAQTKRHFPFWNKGLSNAGCIWSQNPVAVLLKLLQCLIP